MSVEILPKPLDAVSLNNRQHRTLQGGEALFLQNGVAGGLYYLVSGTVDLRRTTKSGHDLLIHRARSGQTFAEASLFSETYHCTATAKGESQLIECRRESVEQLFRTDIHFASQMAARFAHQIQFERRCRELLSIKAADERVLVAIGDALLVDDITSFADTIGLAQETVYRALAQLTKSGQIVKTARGRFELNLDCSTPIIE